MYSRADITLDDRMEIFSRYWRFQDEHGIVSELAEEWKASRHFIYDLAARVRKALDWQGAGRPEEDRTKAELDRRQQRIRELESDVARLEGELEIERRNPGERRFRLLMELALAPVSEDKIVRCLEAAYGRKGRVSSGWVHQQLERAGAAALSLMQDDRINYAVESLALDEVFRHRQPILMAVDPRTLMALQPEAAENRKGETWRTQIDQYPKLKMIVSDQGSGLLKGTREAFQGIEHQYDLFHFKRELRRLLRTQEARCYEAMEQVEKARKLIDEPRMLSSARVRAGIEHRQKAAALDVRLEAFDWVEVIIEYLEEQFEPYDDLRGRVRRRAEAEAAVNEVLALLREIKAINTKALIRAIEGARVGLFTFLTILEKKLEKIAIEWHSGEGDRNALFGAIAGSRHLAGRAHLSARAQQRYLLALIGLRRWEERVKNFSAVSGEVYEALDEVVRASSAVECLNSILRPYIAVKKHLSRGFLALIALYWNMHPLKQRGGKTPFQLSGIDLGDGDWVRLIEHEMRAQERLSAKRAA